MAEERQRSPVVRQTVSCGTATLRDVGGELEVLLVQAKEGSVYGFPKGHVEEGESHLDAAARETLEETGIEVVPFDVELGSSRVLKRDEDKKVIVYYALLSADDGSEARPADGENYAVEWHPVDALPEPVRSQREMFERLSQTASAFYEWATTEER